MPHENGMLCVDLDKPASKSSSHHWSIRKIWAAPKGERPLTKNRSEQRQTCFKDSPHPKLDETPGRNASHTAKKVSALSHGVTGHAEQRVESSQSSIGSCKKRSATTKGTCPAGCVRHTHFSRRPRCTMTSSNRELLVDSGAC